MTIPLIISGVACFILGLAILPYALEVVAMVTGIPSSTNGRGVMPFCIISVMILVLIAFNMRVIGIL
jgi:hypothetical protein